MPPETQVKHRSRVRVASAAVAVVATACLVGALARGSQPPGPTKVVLGAFATDLSDRTPHQRYNARRAAASVDGKVVQPGKVFSFNQAVKGWTADRGFLRAPVSYDGVLVDDYGGGVCQASTTLYNAALIAGLPILERHPHTFSPGYAPVGRDAAVAYSGVDLRFRNPYPWPITIRALPEDHRLVCRVEGPVAPATRAVISERILDRFPAPQASIEPGSGFKRTRWRATGRDGVRVTVYRDFFRAGNPAGTELISDNTYLPIARTEWGSG